MSITRRDALYGVAAATLVPLLPGVAAAQSAAGFDITSYVDPELRPTLPMLRQYAATPINAQTLATVRAGSERMAMPLLASPPIVARQVPGAAGQPAVTVYVINAGTSGPPRPAILHTHGGGYVIGSARSDRRRLQEIAQALDCVIVSVEYRLAPETTWRGSLEDNYAGLKWLHANAASLGADPARIAVMGESAGGGHAALLAIVARDRGEVPVAFQALVYPMLDDRTGSTVVKPPQMGALIWTPASNRFGWSSFLGAPAGSRGVPVAAVPARVAEVRGLPPAFIGVGGIDLFVDEDVDYARRLIDAGIGCRLEVVPGAFHGFDGVPGTRIGARFRQTLLDALRGGLGLPPAAA